jgi:hypothetical protein
VVDVAKSTIPKKAENITMFLFFIFFSQKKEK